MTLSEAKALLVKAQNNEPLSQEEKTKLREAFIIIKKDFLSKLGIPS